MNDNLAKILILGESQVGKSSILNRISDKNFVDFLPPTLGIDYKIVNIKINENEKLSLQIWDTAGQERFKSITESIFRGTHGILLVFDLTSKSSFKKIYNWIETIKNKQENPVIILIGNKKDLKDTYISQEKNLDKLVTDDDIKNFLENDGKNINYFETSAKEDINIWEAFETIAYKIRDILKKENNIVIKNKKKPLNKKCCN